MTAKIGLGKYHPIEVEDDVSAAARVSGRRDGLFAVTTGEAPGTNRVEIAGDQGKLELDTEIWKLKFFWNEMSDGRVQPDDRGAFRAAGVSPEIDVPAAADGADAESHVVILENFRDAIRGGASCSSPRRRRRSGRWRSATRCSCRASGQDRRAADRRRADGARLQRPSTLGSRSWLSVRPGPRPRRAEGGR